MLCRLRRWHVACEAYTASTPYAVETELRRECIARALVDDRVGLSAPEVHDLAQELCPDRVRSGCCVGFADGMLLAKPTQHPLRTRSGQSSCASSWTSGGMTPTRSSKSACAM